MVLLYLINKYSRSEHKRLRSKTFKPFTAPQPLNRGVYIN